MNHTAKIAVLGAGISIALIGVLTMYLRRKRNKTNNLHSHIIHSHGKRFIIQRRGERCTSRGSSGVGTPRYPGSPGGGTTSTATPTTTVTTGPSSTRSSGGAGGGALCRGGDLDSSSTSASLRNIKVTSDDPSRNASFISGQNSLITLDEQSYEVVEIPVTDNDSSIVTLMNASINTSNMNSSELCDLGMQLLQLSLQHFELGLDKLEELPQPETSISAQENSDPLQPKLKSQLVNLIRKVKLECFTTSKIQNEHDKKLLQKVLHNSDMDIALKQMDDEFEEKISKQKSLSNSHSREIVNVWNTRSSEQGTTSQFWNDDDSSDDGSFISAVSVIDYDDIELLQMNYGKLGLISEGLAQLTADSIPCRKIRTTMCKCSNDSEFLVKLYSIRRAFTLLFTNPANRDYFVTSGRQLLVNLLLVGDKDIDSFIVAFDSMIQWLSDKDNWPVVDEELSNRGVVMLNFYDIVLDFMMFDSFEDLENAPTSLLTIAQNRWMSNGFKEGALSTTIWSLLKAKKGLLRNQNGFISHFYEISEFLSPTMAWGYLGPDSDIKEKCLFFKEALIEYTGNIFSFNSVRYTNLNELSADILSLSKQMIANALSVIKPTGQFK